MAKEVFVRVKGGAKGRGPRGRKPLPPVDGEAKTIACELPPDYYGVLFRLAQALGCPVTALVRQAVGEKVPAWREMLARLAAERRAG